MHRPALPTSMKDLVDQNYSTANPLIQWLVSRLSQRVALLMDKIDAFDCIGLDVGCGEGHMLGYLDAHQSLGDLVAVDLNRSKLEFAKRYFPVCTYLNADATALTFKTNSFDYAIAAEILEHLPDPVWAIREIRRVVKPGGYFIVSVPHEPFFHWGNLVRGKYWERGGRTPDHVNFWSRAEFKRFLNRFVTIQEEHWVSVFPWLLYLGKFK